MNEITVSKSEDGIGFVCAIGKDLIRAYVGEDGGVALMPLPAGDLPERCIFALTNFFAANPELATLTIREQGDDALVRINQARIVRAGDHLVDRDTGEFIADYHWGYDKQIKTAEDLTVYMARLQASDAVRSAHIEQKKQVIAAMDAIIKQDENRNAYYEQWLPQAREWAADHKPLGKQTVETPYGKLAFRKASFKTKVVLLEDADKEKSKAIEAAAVAWCETNEAFADAVKVEKSILVGVLDKVAQSLPKTVFPKEIFDIKHGEESCTANTGFGEKINHKIENEKKTEVTPSIQQAVLTGAEVDAAQS